MLRNLIFTCMSRSSWCYATWSSLACQGHLDATQLDLHLHVKIILMLRNLIFTCMSRSSWCYATWSSLACHDHLDATWRVGGFFNTSMFWHVSWGLLIICFPRKKENKNPWSTHRLLLSWTSGCSESTLRCALAKSDTRSCPRPWKSDKPNVMTSQFDDDSRLMTHKWPAKFTKRSSLSLLFWTWKNGHLSKINGNFHSKRCCDGWKKQRRSVRRIPCSLPHSFCNTFVRCPSWHWLLQQLSLNSSSFCINFIQFLFAQGSFHGFNWICEELTTASSWASTVKIKPTLKILAADS